jgi:hypothetical protein
MQPTDAAATRILLRRGGFEIKNGRLINSGPQVDAPFIVQMGGADLRVIVNFPATINVSTQFTSQYLKLDFDTPLLVTFLDRLRIDATPLEIPDQLLWKSFQATDDSIAYEFDERGKSDNHFHLLIRLIQLAAFQRNGQIGPGIMLSSVARAVTARALVQNNDDCSCRCVAKELTRTLASDGGRKCTRCGCDGFGDFSPVSGDGKCDNSARAGATGPPYCGHSEGDHTRA